MSHNKSDNSNDFGFKKPRHLGLGHFFTKTVRSPSQNASYRNKKGQADTHREGYNQSFSAAMYAEASVERTLSEKKRSYEC